MNLKIIPLLVTITAVFYFACNTTDPPGDEAIQLAIEDVSCTEAWIKVAAENQQLPIEINILSTDS